MPVKMLYLQIKLSLAIVPLLYGTICQTQILSTSTKTTSSGSNGAVPIVLVDIVSLEAPELSAITSRRSTIARRTHLARRRRSAPAEPLRVLWTLLLGQEGTKNVEWRLSKSKLSIWSIPTSLSS